MTANHDLADAADAAAAVADRAPVSSTRRKAYACAAIALHDARTVTAARKILNADAPEFIRAAALAAPDQVVRSAS